MSKVWKDFISMPSEQIPLLFFSNSTVRGGAEEHILTLLRQLDRNLFRFHLVCPAECADKLAADLPPDVELIRLSLQKPFAWGPAREFAKILRERNIGILHSHLFGASFAASPVGRLCRIPVVMETPHIREAWRRGLIKGHFVVDRMVGRCVDHYIAVSAANGQYLIEEKGLPKQKVHVIQNGCDLKKFDPTHQAPQGMKASLGFDETDPILLVLGRLEPQKGHRFLLEAMGDVRKEFPKARVICVGDGALSADLTQQVRELQLEENVCFVGFQSNIPDWLAMADISVLPSLFEGLPLVAIESLGAQRPMIATAVDGTSEVVLNEKTGLTVPPSDPRALGQAILRLLRDPALRQQLATEGRKWVLANFSQEQQVARTQELYLKAWNAPSALQRRARASKMAARAGEDASHAVENNFGVVEKR